MKTCPGLSPDELQVRTTLVSVAKSMLAGNTSFFEGAAQVLRLREGISGAPNEDPDFDTFVLIYSDTDHLPLSAQRYLWNKESLAALAPEFLKIEEWAASFAPAACLNLIARYEHEAP